MDRVVGIKINNSLSVRRFRKMMRWFLSLIIVTSREFMELSTFLSMGKFLTYMKIVQVTIKILSNVVFWLEIKKIASTYSCLHKNLRSLGSSFKHQRINYRVQCLKRSRTVSYSWQASQLTYQSGHQIDNNQLHRQTRNVFEKFPINRLIFT